MYGGWGGREGDRDLERNGRWERQEVRFIWGERGHSYYTQTRHSSIASTCIQVIDVPYMSQRKYVVREERERERQRGGGGF